jgi:hypothetical protein
MRSLTVFAFIALATPAFAASDAAPDMPHANNARFSAIPIPGDPKGIWLVDTFTGSLAHCEFLDADKEPKCTPWTPAPGDSPFYRWDAETKNLIPMNEAARRKDAERQKLK